MKETGADVSVAFVPPAFTKDACIEAIDAEIPLLVVITEGVPVQDTAAVVAYLEGKSTRMIGPNCPGSSRRRSHWPVSRRTPSRARVRSASSRSRAP
jgi:succinyl-CoA synthetase alpha subunit